MKQKLFSIAAILIIGKATAQNFSLMYPFTSVTGTANLITTDPTPAPTASGVTSGSFMAVGTGTGSTASGVFSFVGWPTGATNGNDAAFTGSLNPASYYNITFTPQPQYVVSVNSVSFQATRSGTGVRTWAVRTSGDTYSANLSPIACSNTNIAVSNPSFATGTFFWTADSYTAFASQSMCSASVSNLQNQSAPFSIRLYAWNAEGSFGTFRIDSVYVTGNAVFSPNTGLSKITHDLGAQFKLYPNPASSFVFLETFVSEPEKIEIVNMNGTVILSEENSSANKNKVSIDLGSIPKGMYLVRVKSKGNTSVEKFVVSD